MKATKSEQLFKRVKIYIDRKITGKKKGIVTFKKNNFTKLTEIIRNENQQYETPDDPPCRSNLYSILLHDLLVFLCICTLLQN